MSQISEINFALVDSVFADCLIIDEWFSLVPRLDSLALLIFDDYYDGVIQLEQNIKIKVERNSAGSLMYSFYLDDDLYAVHTFCKGQELSSDKIRAMLINELEDFVNFIVGEDKLTV